MRFVSYMIKTVLVSIVLLGAGVSRAAPLVIDLAGIQSVGAESDPGNTVLQFNVGANASITGFSFIDANVTTQGGSWLSEPRVKLVNSSGIGVSTRLTAQNSSDFDFEGTETFSLVADLVALLLDFHVDADGLLKVEFYEFFDDAGVDAIYNSGTLVVNVDLAGGPNGAPEPGSLALLALGLLGLVAACRRR